MSDRVVPNKKNHITNRPLSYIEAVTLKVNRFVILKNMDVMCPEIEFAMYLPNLI